MPMKAGEIVDPAWKVLYKVGGLSFLIDGIILLIIIAISFQGNVNVTTSQTFGLGTIIRAFEFGLLPLPSSAGEGLKLTAANAASAQAYYIAGILLFALLIPAMLALYFVLKDVNKSYTLIAIGIAGGGIAAFFATVGNAFSVIVLAQLYTGASTDAQRAAYLAAAQGSFTVLTVGSNLSNALLYFAAFIASLVMFRSLFGKAAASLGITIGALSILNLVVSLGFFLSLIVSVITVIWVFTVGYKLYKLG